MDQPDDSFNIVDLPVEVLEIVAGYLSVKDLLACCACSRSMREIFSEHSIWWSRCDKQLCHHLRVTPCKVEPHFVPLKFGNSTLSPIPQCKEDFMYQNHLWNNWRQGRQNKQVMRSKEIIETSIFNCFLNSDCVISIFPGRIEFIDVRQTPMVKAANDIKLPEGVRGWRLQIRTRDSYVILTYRSLALVYHVDLSTKESLFKHAFYIEQSQKCADVLREEDVNCLMGDVNHTATNCYIVFNVSLIGNIFIGIRYRESRMHIWNFESGLKLKEQDCLVPNGYVVDFKRSSRKKNVILCVQDREKNSTTLLAYDLTTLNFLSFQTSVEGLPLTFCVLDKYVAIWENEVLNVYNYLTNEQVLTDHPIDVFSDVPCQGFRNNFVFIQDNTLKIFFTSSLSVSTFAVIMKPGMEQELDLCNLADGFVVLNNKFIQVRRIWAGLQRSFPVFEVDDAYKFKELPLNLCILSCNFFLNDTSSRCIVGDKFVIHFW